MRIEPFQSVQAERVSAIVRRNLVEVNSRDYPPELIQSMVEHYSPARILENSRSQHTLVAVQDDQVVGTGSLANFGSAEHPDYYAVTVFVLPELHKRGVGTRLMEAIEREASELDADKITVRAAITAKGFYARLGYSFKDGIEALSEHGHYLMEKKWQKR
ncbi:MAG: GNAT family N-acetyltransferase [Thermoflexales bacterium]|nr:GNAT family N-acetyltransferase [Thermoflexales bacterium]